MAFPWRTHRSPCDQEHGDSNPAAPTTRYCCHGRHGAGGANRWLGLEGERARVRWRPAFGTPGRGGRCYAGAGPRYVGRRDRSAHVRRHGEGLRASLREPDSGHASRVMRVEDQGPLTAEQWEEIVVGEEDPFGADALHLRWLPPSSPARPGSTMFVAAVAVLILARSDAHLRPPPRQRRPPSRPASARVRVRTGTSPRARSLRPCTTMTRRGSSTVLARCARSRLRAATPGGPVMYSPVLSEGPARIGCEGPALAP
jgi:hypothetical protein